MTSEEKIAFKNELHQLALQMIRQRIVEAKQAMDNAQAAANNEEKSSAGDKYETSRAMGHIEKDMYAKQLAANNQELAALLTIDHSTLHHAVTTGSFVVSNEFSFFIVAGLGKINYKERDIYFLSPAAPVAKLLSGKIVGDTVLFKNKEIMIKELY